MHVMSNLEYSFLVKELSSALVGKHFGRIRKLREGLYRMKIGGSEILCELGVRINITRYIEESKETDKFVEKAEKELDNARLISITQINNDRIVSFDFDKGSLIFEMFKGGNAILVRDGKTVAAAKYESWSDREIKSGSEYRPPKTAPLSKLEVSDKYIIVSLMRLPLGKEYAMEALVRAKIEEKAPGNSLSGNRLMELERAIAQIQSEAKPCAFFDAGGKMADYSLAKLTKYSSPGTFETKEFGTLSEAADEYHAHAEKPNPKLEKLLDRMEKQKERLAALIEEEKSNREKGDLIYARYQEMEHLLQLAKKGAFEEIDAAYAAKIDKKDKFIEIEL